MGFIDTLSTITVNAYILFSFALGIWAASSALRNQGVSGAYTGALFTCASLAVVMLLLWLVRALGGETLRWVYGLYMAYFIVVYPGTFAIMRGRDDRTAALVYAGVAFFTAFSGISASDPGRGVIVVPLIPGT